MSEIIELARRLAMARPDARLACPICAATVNAPNLARHLDRRHPGQDDAGRSWAGRGVRGGRLRWDDGTLRWRNRAGLRRRRIRPVAAVLGSTITRRSYGHYASTAQATLIVDQHSGSYVKVVADNGRSITVRCRSGVSARTGWSGWESGPQVRRWQITVAPEALVALLYLLSEEGVVRPADR